MNKKSIKTLLKGTILIMIISLFLEINYADILNYLVFLLISYLILIGYIYYKTKQSFEIGEDGVSISVPFRKGKVRYSEIIRVFSHSGYLQRKFALETVFIITRRGNYVIKDLEIPNHVVSDIEEKIDLKKLKKE